ncbi:MAG: type II asparaginase [Pseudomonadota bacterium]
MTNQKNITILATGGTIAGSGLAADQSNYEPAKISADVLVNSVAGIKKLANIKAEQILAIGSQDIEDADWLKIARRTNELLNQEDVDGVVITHGTDTLEETAYFLNLVVNSQKPVVLVGSMRPSTALGADGAINLYNAVALAVDYQAIGKGVLVVIADKIFAARDVAKINTVAVEAFGAPNAGAIGQICYGKAQIYYQPTRTHTKNSEFKIAEISNLPKVDIVQMYAGFDAGVIDYLVSAKSQAIIVASLGNGNFYKDALPKLIAAAKSGIVIIKSSRAGAGTVVLNGEINDDEYGFLSAGNLSAQKARILAKLALTQTNNLEKIKEIFDNY